MRFVSQVPALLAQRTLRLPLAKQQQFRMKHHLMVGTWTPPGAIFTVEFDDEAWTLKLVKRTAIPEDEPISWMTFDVSQQHGDGCFLVPPRVVSI